MQSQIILMLSALYDFWCDLSFALSSPALPVIVAGANRPWLTQHSARPPTSLDKIIKEEKKEVKVYTFQNNKVKNCLSICFSVVFTNTFIIDFILI